MSGTVVAGTQPVAGATFSLWSAGTTVTQVGPFIATDSTGQFTLHFNCPSANAPMFVIAAGGNAGSGGANLHISLASALGPCGSMPSTIVVNELTSAAAAYAFSGLAPAAGSGAVGFQGNAIGLSNAFALVSKLVVAGTGLFNASGHETNTSAVQQELDTLANAMAACNNSNNVSSTSAVCAELFSCAQANATFVSTGQACTGGTSTAVTDTMNAALSIAQNAGLASSAGIFDVAAASAAYSPALAAVPNDFSLSLIYQVKNFGPLSIDASGNVWILSDNPSSGTPPTLSVAEFDATGFLISPTTGWTTGGISNLDTTDTTNMAIDPQGNVWVGGSSSNIAEINSQGGGVAPASGWIAGAGPGKTAGVAIDSAGNVWFADGNAGDVFELSSAGKNVSGNNGFASTVCDCTGIAADNAGNVWLIGLGAQPGIAQVNASGVQGSSVEPPSPYNGHFSFVAIAGDAAGNFWITDQPQHGVWEFTPSGTAGSFSAAPFANLAGGGTFPKGIAVDGAGHKWVANQQYNSPTLSSLTELSADGTLNLSPATGFGSGLINGAYAVAVDQSGDVWVTDGGVTVAEFVGAAAPTKNPIASAVDAGSFVP